MGLSWVHILVVIAIFVLLFGGRGKVSDLMGDVAKGIKSFKKGLAEDDEPARKPEPRIIEGSASQETSAKDKTTANG